MEYTVKKLSQMAGVSTRTLRYYDEIGLLAPGRINSSGYRIYGKKEVELLQQILFYRELGVELGMIAKIIKDPEFDFLQALEEHKAELIKRQSRLNILIETVDKTISQAKGEIKMTDKEKFEGFKKDLIEENERKYGSEVSEKYGEDAKKQSNARLMNLTTEEYDKMTALGEEILKGLEAAVRNGENPEGENGLKLAAMHKDWLSFTWGGYSKDAHQGLAQMYVEDERFTQYYDREVPGCAVFLRDAIDAFIR